MFRIFSALIFFLMIPLVFAKEVSPLQADQAFEFSTYLDAKKQLTLEWHIAPGYHLYRDKLKVEVVPTSQVKIGKLQLPAGKIIKDKVFGTYPVYFGTVKVIVPLLTPASGILNLDVNYQGCSDEGFCYPPEKRNVHIDLSKPVDTSHIIVTSDIAPTAVAATTSSTEALFQGKNKFIIGLTFLGLGLLLAFTPCVLPMIPILSGIIVGHGKNINVAKAFFLSLAYVLGMAITYAIAGMIVALLGSHIQTLFQTTWAIVIVSSIFVLLALSLFGFYDLELPPTWQRRLTAFSNKQKGGTYIGVFLMGVISSLIVSPCVSAPLVGVLAYIAQTGDVVLGGASLLALGLGMGIPLILIGVSAGKILPKAGPWMVMLERFFGILLLAVAIIMLSRVIPGPLVLFLWAVLLICSAIFMGVLVQPKNNWQNLVRGLAVVLLIYGVILIIGAVLGNSDPLHPWEKMGTVTAKQPSSITVKDMTQLDEELASAKSENKPVMLDFYADWCSACVAMERHVFTQASIREELADYVVLRADITANSAFDKALLKRFHVIAPPTILFFNMDGKEMPKRIVGEVNKKEFLDHLQDLKVVMN